MQAYFHGHVLPHLPKAINQLWIEMENQVVFVRFEVLKNGIQLLDIQFYNAGYRPWRNSNNYTLASDREVQKVTQAISRISRLLETEVKMVA